MSSDYNAYYAHWSDISEWNNVKRSILSDSMENIIKGYETILMWKLRNPNLPAYVECTCGLLEVMIQEDKLLKSIKQSEIIPLVAENNLRLSYSAALIRFVNHVSSVSSYKGDTLFYAARTQNIPDWIINMRHDVSHGQTLPQLDALHIAAKLCFKWLIDNYWADEESSMGELDSEFITSSSNLTDKYQVGPILKMGIRLWYKLSSDNARMPKKYFIDSLKTTVVAFKDFVMFLSENNYARSAAAEPLATISKAVEEAISYQKEREEPINKKKLVKIPDVIEALFGVIENISAKGNTKLLLVKVLMESNFLSDSGNCKQWEEMILSLQHLKAFSFLLDSLFHKAGEGNTDAVNWLSTLATSIKSLKNKWKIFKKLEGEAEPDANLRILKQKAIDLDKESYGNVKINLGMVKPPKITLEMMKNLLKNPDSVSLGVVSQYLKLVEPALDQLSLSAFEDLISIYSGDINEEDLELTDKIFTVEDLKLDKEDEASKAVKVVDEDDESGWRKSSMDGEIWNKCAIGLLPGQKSVDCGLPSNLKWNLSSTRKRCSSLLMDYVKMKKSRA